MANTLGGFQPKKYITGTPYMGAVTRYVALAADATAFFVGDPVKLSGSTDGNGIRAVTKAAAGDAIVGICVGVAAVPTLGGISSGASPTLDTPQFRAASTLKYVFVVDDPNVLFECLNSGTVAEADVGLNANHVASSGSTTTGISNATVDGASKAVTATLTFKIVEVTQTPDNDPAGATKRLLVKINNHQLAAGTGVVGV